MASKKRGKGMGRPPPPDGLIRRSQIVGTFGPGAMIDLVKNAVLVGGLASWRFGGVDTEVKEERLLSRLRSKHPGLMALRAPPEHDEDRGRGLGVSALEFPRWFVCQQCRIVEQKRFGDPKRNGRYVHGCAKGAFFVPVRFVVACPHGHLDDFHWLKFLTADHHAPGCTSRAEARLREGPTGSFDDVRVECAACHRSRPLKDAMAPGAIGDCSGKMPWLGAVREECAETPKLIVRTASNSYFPLVVSALSIPGDRKCQTVVREHLELLKPLTKGTDLATLVKLFEHLGPALAPFTEEEIVRTTKQELGLEKRPREELRPAEYKRITNAEPYEHGARPRRDEDFAAYALPRAADWPKAIAKVVLLPRLREVRAQTGFTRIDDLPRDVLGEYPDDLKQIHVKPARLANDSPWLPAVEVFGEGIFIELDETAVQKWEARVAAREAMLANAYAKFRAANETAPEYFGVRYYLLHSLAHLLMQAVSMRCGYTSSSIRERIYSTPPGGDPPMAGVLLSTGTPGSEGTLGGLAAQGHHIVEHLREAWDLGRLCSNDPVCARHDPVEDPTDRRVHGAACHGCLFIAEPSCEQYNRLLDRALVVPTLGATEFAFFQERP